jgi:diguanylate cyclase (GGDEF)-like protein/PAS domain S-box-containing protein
MLDIILESIRTLVLGFLLFWLWKHGKERVSYPSRGWNMILLGFSLLLFGSILDITDNFESLNWLIVIGDTEIEAILEKLVGSLGGFALLAIGLIVWISTFKKLSDEMEEQKKSDENRRLSTRVFNDTHEGITITNADRIIVDVNPAFCDITGYSRDEVIGQNLRILCSGKQSPEFFREMWQQIDEKGHWQGELWNRKKTGELYAELLTISELKDDDNNVINYVDVFTDITSSKEHQEELRLMAHYDVLTGLPNRALFTDRFTQAIAHSNRTHHELAVCFIDLDNFKPVNDNYGHEVGDQLLIEVAERITENIREEDTVSRQGGDEFAILLNDIESFVQCEQTLQRIHHALAQPFLIDDYPHKITASSGVTLYPHDDSDIDTLLRHADQAMYQAKLAGKHRYHLFNPEHDQRTIQKHHQLEEIEQALINNQFQLYYQPKVNMVTGDVFGAEALIRWIHPEKGLIPPLDFLPTLEGSELEIEVGNWVINQALSQLEVWHQLDIRPEVSINISSHHLLSGSFFNQLEASLAKHPSIDSQCLQLEILESSALGDLTAIRAIIKTCQTALGVNVALDDFGTGYSSLTHLRSLPVDTIKIDQSFVRDMLDDPSDYAIIDGIIGLSDSFNREVIAEGVETTNHGLMLLIMGCEAAQGYGITKPMPADEFPQWLTEYTPNQDWQQCGNKHRSNKENKVELFRLITDHWKDQFVYNIQSLPKNIEQWPIMNSNRCPCDTWIKRARQERLFEPEGLKHLDKAHEALHSVARSILLQYQDGDVDIARGRLDELLSYFDDMNNVLEICK